MTKHRQITPAFRFGIGAALLASAAFMSSSAKADLDCSASGPGGGKAKGDNLRIGPRSDCLRPSHAWYAGACKGCGLLAGGERRRTQMRPHRREREHRRPVRMLDEGRSLASLPRQIGPLVSWERKANLSRGTGGQANLVPLARDLARFERSYSHGEGPLPGIMTGKGMTRCVRLHEHLLLAGSNHRVKGGQHPRHLLCNRLKQGSQTLHSAG
jgi:hypothetical protein